MSCYGFKIWHRRLHGLYRDRRRCSRGRFASLIPVGLAPLSPMTGDVFVFFSKNRQSVKLLRWDTDGFLLYQKRLEKGSFEQPRLNPSTGYYELSWETFSLIMSGISLESVRFRKRYRTRFAGRLKCSRKTFSRQYGRECRQGNTKGLRLGNPGRTSRADLFFLRQRFAQRRGVSLR